MPLSYTTFVAELNQIVMLAYLQPYLKDVDKFNKNRTQIAQALQDFLFKHDEYAQHKNLYTPDEIFKAFAGEIREDKPTEEETKAFGKNVDLKLNLLNEIYKFSEEFATELEYYTSAEKALDDLREDNFKLSRMAADIANNNNETKKSIIDKMKFYIQTYFKIQAELNPYNTTVDNNKISTDAQKEKNDKIRGWADKNLQQFWLLRHLGLWMKSDPDVKKQYYNLVSMKNEDEPLTASQLKEMEKILCLSTGHITDSKNKIKKDKRDEESIDALLPFLFNNAATMASHQYFHIDAQGNPHEFSYRRQLVTAQQALFTALLLSLVITSLFTFIPVIPIAAEQSLNQLYSAIFLASDTPVLSLGAIYGISVAFMFVIDILTFAAAKHWHKRETGQNSTNGELYVDRMKQKYIGPKIAKEAAQYTDSQIHSLDDKLDENIRATRTPMYTFYEKGQSKSKEEQTTIQNKNKIVSQL